MVNKGTNLAQMPDNRQQIAARLTDELNFIGDLLDKLKEQIQEDGLQEYMNGGNRETAALSSYIKLITKYQSIYRQLSGTMEASDTKDSLTEWLRNE